MEQELGAGSTIVTTNYNANYMEVYELFRTEEKVGPKVQFENIYDWLSDYKLLSIPTTRFRNKPIIKETEREIEGLKSVEKKNSDAVRYYDEEDEYVLYRKFYPDNASRRIRGFHDERFP